MFGCSSWAAASASARKRFTSVSLAKRPANTILSATTRLRLICRARHTTPMPPWAISSNSSKSPNRRAEVSSAPSPLAASELSDEVPALWRTIRTRQRGQRPPTESEPRLNPHRAHFSDTVTIHPGNEESHPGDYTMLLSGDFNQVIQLRLDIPGPGHGVGHLGADEFGIT